MNVVQRHPRASLGFVLLAFIGVSTVDYRIARETQSPAVKFTADDFNKERNGPTPNGISSTGRVDRKEPRRLRLLQDDMPDMQWIRERRAKRT